MIPYTQFEINGTKYYVHGIVHPVLGCPFKKDYIDSVRNYVLDRLDYGEIWFSESGLEKLFDLPIKGIPFSRKTKIVLPFSAYLLRFFFNLIPKPEREIFAEQMTTVEDLIIYRQMFQLPETLVRDLDLFISGKKPIFYNSLINRFKREYDFLTSQTQSSHFLCGIAHEYIIIKINEAELIKLFSHSL